MIADKRFAGVGKEFWAHVRTVSQEAGYTVRDSGQVRVHSIEGIVAALHRLGLGSKHIEQRGIVTPFGRLLQDYFAYRADVLNSFVEPRLMDAARARAVFVDLKARVSPPLSDSAQ